MRFFLPLVLSLTFLFPALAHAYGEGGGSPGGLSNATTNKVVRLLTGGVKNCQRLDKAYRYDCYRNTYSAASTLLKRDSAYADAQKALADVEQSLARTIARNLDAGQPPARLGVQRFRAIRPTAIPQARREFLTALDQAETRLLRSQSEGGEHFVRIAAALNTNKVLLRSAMLVPALRPLVQFAGLARRAGA